MEIGLNVKCGSEDRIYVRTGRYVSVQFSSSPWGQDSRLLLDRMDLQVLNLHAPPANHESLPVTN